MKQSIIVLAAVALATVADAQMECTHEMCCSDPNCGSIMMECFKETEKTAVQMTADGKAFKKCAKAECTVEECCEKPKKCQAVNCPDGKTYIAPLGDFDTVEKCCKDVPETDKLCKDFKAADCPKDTTYTPASTTAGKGTASKETCCFKMCKGNFPAAECKAPKIYQENAPCVESGTAHVTPTVAALFLSMLAMVGCSV